MLTILHLVVALEKPHPYRKESVSALSPTTRYALGRSPSRIWWNIAARAMGNRDRVSQGFF